MRIADENDVLKYLKNMYTIEEIADILIESKNMTKIIVRRLKDNGRWRPKEEIDEAKKKIQVLIIDGKTLEQIIKELGSQGISVNFIKDNYEKLKNASKALKGRKSEKSYQEAIKMVRSSNYASEEIKVKYGKKKKLETDRIMYEKVKSMYKQGKAIGEIAECVGLNLIELSNLIEFWKKEERSQGEQGKQSKGDNNEGSKKNLKGKNNKESKKKLDREAKEQIQALILKGKTLEQIIKELESKSISGKFIEDNYKKIINNPNYLKRLEVERRYQRAIEMAQSGKYTLEQVLIECGEMKGLKKSRLKDEIMYTMYSQGRTIDEISVATGLNAHYIGKTIELWEKSKGNNGDSIVEEESKSEGDTSEKTILNSDDRRKAILKLVAKGKATEEDLDFLFRNVTEETDNLGTIVYTINVLMVWGHLALAKRIIDKRLSYDDCNPKLKEKLKSLKELIIKKMTTKKIIELLKEGKKPIIIATELKVLEVDVYRIARINNIPIKPTYSPDEEYYIL